MHSGPSNDVTVELMTDEDLDQVLEIERKSFTAPWSKRLFQQTLSFPASFNFVLRKMVDNKVVGYANFYLIRNETQILNVAVAPESRRKGYASTLLAYAIASLTHRGATDFFLEVRVSNDEAKRLYERLGFKKVGLRKRYYSETNEDALVMHLKVDSATDC